MADEREQREPESKTPGHFVSEELRAQTARFIEELKKRLQRGESRSGPKLGPPR
jgi:hypothetical protein